jgi:signal transduction histidine kinase
MNADTVLIIITVGILLIVLAIAIVLLPRVLRIRERENVHRITEMDMVVTSFQTMGSELKSLKEQLVIKERLAALGEISAGIAHEFRNPMNVISGYAKLLAKSLPDTDERKELVNGILHEVEGMHSVMNELLGFSRFDSTRKDPIRLQSLLTELVRTFPDYEQQLICITVPDDLICLADATLLRQAFKNLIRNALDAGATNVQICAGVDDMAVHKPVWISVVDNGPGLDEGEKQKVFIPFYTTKANGTGIGLALVQKIVLAHGGTITIGGQKGSGAIFRLTLPGVVSD